MLDFDVKARICTNGAGLDFNTGLTRNINAPTILRALGKDTED